MISVGGKELSASAVAADGEESNDLLYKFTLTVDPETRMNDRRNADFADLLLYFPLKVTTRPVRHFR